MEKPEIIDTPVSCQKCGVVFKSFLRRTVKLGSASAEFLIDADNAVVYDLVMDCRYCKTRFHWHTSEKGIVKDTLILKKVIDSIDVNPTGQGEGVSKVGGVYVNRAGNSLAKKTPLVRNP